MNIARPIELSVVSADGRTRIPLAVRERLRLKPGDTLRYRFAANGIVVDKARCWISKAPNVPINPFAIFSEWSSGADDKDYAEL